MKKIVIIGAGPAGLTAGYELLKKAKKDEVEVMIGNKVKELEEKKGKVNGLQKEVDELQASSDVVFR